MEPKRSKVTATRNADSGQWEFDPPFQGGGYIEFKRWHAKAQEAVAEYEKQAGITDNTGDLVPILDPDQIDWHSLSPEEFQVTMQNIDIWLDGDVVLTVEWDAGDARHNGCLTIARVGNAYLANADEGMFGPYSSPQEAFLNLGWNVVNGATKSIESAVLRYV